MARVFTKGGSDAGDDLVTDNKGVERDVSDSGMYRTAGFRLKGKWLRYPNKVSSAKAGEKEHVGIAASQIIGLGWWVSLTETRDAALAASSPLRLGSERSAGDRLPLS